MSKQVKIEADIMWAFLNEKNGMSNKYQVDLCNLSPDMVSMLEENGVKVHNKDGKGFYVTAKSANYPITTVDTDNKPITVKVANGSKGVALCKFYDYTKPYKGVGVGINHLTVTSLIPYEAASKTETSEETL